MRQGSRPAVPDDAAMVEDFLKLGGGGSALSGCQVCPPRTYTGWRQETLLANGIATAMIFAVIQRLVEARFVDLKD
jgi:hypothetical protein